MLEADLPDTLHLRNRDRAKWPFSATVVAGYHGKLQEIKLDFNIKLSVITHQRDEVDRRLRERYDTYRLK